MNTPDYMPLLSEGAHASPRDGVCAMEAAAFLAGEPHSDKPACVHPVIASMARKANDHLSDERRGELWPLIIRCMGTADTREDVVDPRVLSVRLAAWCARQVLHLVGNQAVALAAIEAAEAWADRPCIDHAAAAYTAAIDAHTAAGFDATDAAIDAAAAAIDAAAAAAYAPYAAHSATDAAIDAAAAAIDAATGADDANMVALLTGLIDHHAELTGHTPVTVTDDEVRMLAEAVRA